MWKRLTFCLALCCGVITASGTVLLCKWKLMSMLPWVFVPGLIITLALLATWATIWAMEGSEDAKTSSTTP